MNGSSLWSKQAAYTCKALPDPHTTKLAAFVCGSCSLGGRRLGTVSLHVHHVSLLFVSKVGRSGYGGESPLPA